MFTGNKRTVAQKIGDCFAAFKCIKENRPVKREGTKDGSVATKPIFDDMPDIPESEVLKECLTWLKSHGILAWRNNTGSGTLGISGFYHYGITDGGDIIGCLPNGKHFEIEAKAGKGGRWIVGQQIRSVEIKENQGLYFLVHGLQELVYYFEDLI
jgi:hypothetical protein